MRKYLYPLALSSSLLISQFVTGQEDRFAFAITDKDPAGTGWNVLRKLDLGTGTYGDVILAGSNASIISYDAASRKAIASTPDARYGNLLQAPFSTGVAAMAYDKRNNRLYFTPMFIDQLRYIDLRSMKVYQVTDKAFTTRGHMHNSEGSIVTRMTIAPDGFGYAITNDGESVIRFSTGRKLDIEQLGPLVDDPKNIMSVKSRCSSWGGDMIADDAGNLYIFTSRNVLFKVNIQDRIAVLQSPITGLPNGFTINGAVVNENNQVLVSSAVDGKGWYVLDPSNWSATLFHAPSGVYRSSDLANSNYLRTRGRNNTPEGVTARRNLPLNENIILYPNPVKADHFTVQFGKIQAGTYEVEMTDFMGRVVLKKIVNVNAELQVEQISLRNITAKGVYLINVVDQEKRSVFNQKLVVQ